MNPSERPDAVLTLVRGAEVYSPRYLGKCDILLAGGKILAVQEGPLDTGRIETRIIEGHGLVAVPGFIDSHVHILGGGGEGGPATRTPEIMASDLALAGITTLVGCLGTDSVSRSMTSLVAKARGLCAEGLSCFVYSGSYQVPLVTATGSIQSDMLLIDLVLGAGEIALADHRSSQPTYQDFLSIVAATRVGGLLSGKAGIVNIHMGDGRQRLDYLERLVSETEIPARHLVPTHMGRSTALLEAGIRWARGGSGRHLDLTTSSGGFGDGIGAARALRLLYDAGVSCDAVSMSSDAQGSLPVFSPSGEFLGLGVGRADSLLSQLRMAVQGERIPLEEALRAVTAVPAVYLGLSGKGRISPGADADLVLLGQDMEIHTVIAGGSLLVQEGKAVRVGTFEKDLRQSVLNKRFS